MAKHTPTSVEPHVNGGTQRLYDLPNGLWASAICTPYSYGGDRGLWELHVVREGKPVDIDGLTVGAVAGWLDEDALDAALDRFAALP